MGIDMQKGPPIPKEPIELSTFLVNPWYRRGKTRAIGKTCDEEAGSQAIPSVDEASCEEGARVPLVGSQVYIKSGNQAAADVLVADPTPRRLGQISGPIGSEISRLCRANVSSISGKVVPAIGEDGQRVWIQIDGR